MYICNTEVFGYIPNQVAHSSIEEAAQTFIDFKVDTLGEISITQMFFIVNTMTYNSSLFLPTPPPPPQSTTLQSSLVSSYLHQTHLKTTLD